VQEYSLPLNEESALSSNRGSRRSVGHHHESLLSRRYSSKVLDYRIQRFDLIRRFARVRVGYETSELAQNCLSLAIEFNERFCAFCTATKLL
jgi:hypothetical protein